MESDYIKREDAHIAVDIAFDEGLIGSSERAHQEIDRMPAADVEPIRHGSWEEKLSTGGYPISRCTVCDQALPLTALYYKGFNYCPFCGAKMDGDEE